jgi:hypothetical protein
MYQGIWSRSPSLKEGEAVLKEPVGK